MLIDSMVTVVEIVATAKIVTMIRRLFAVIILDSSLKNVSKNLNITIPFYRFMLSVYDLNKLLKFLLAICAI
ncbi:hypothetical protein BML2537_29580 [Providencia stuartii]|uniref:Uncharacterized protein n=3 Tax=Providencia stuartii TaxID=588 RepID=A0AA86YU96_PROST|nr:hypothetical protein BGK56_07580 [Providencia stuartii]EDU60326.1 hypothetical protein PROSTU_03532 [Providencia stuartii ATCC 25827]KNZ85302.1 hypothetical protein AFL46_09200 [Providencia stuartii]OMH53560.1 hypothetical protein BTZ17_05495 [Providencia stuartii]BBV09464.1 hypothetical protein BML2537_29580 [Providencia stuartii]